MVSLMQLTSVSPQPNTTYQPSMINSRAFKPLKWLLLKLFLLSIPSVFPDGIFHHSDRF